MTDTEFDVLLLGATGITGRIALEYLTGRCTELGVTFAVGARRPERVQELSADVGIEAPPTFRVDIDDHDTLTSFVARGRVLINLVGPYTGSGRRVIESCIEAGTHYLDLTAETQFVHEIDTELHDAAESAGVSVVQTAGFEALPADLSVEIARAELAARGLGPLVSADVQLTVSSAPATGLADALSGGTAQSIARVFTDPRPTMLRDVAFRVGDRADAARVRAASPNRLWSRVTGGRVVAPMVPVAFINPPVIHRSAWLAARERGDPFTPLRYRDGARFGRFGGATGWLALLAASAQSALQWAVITTGSAPSPVRRTVGRMLAALLPASGTGPSGPQLNQWRWGMVVRGISDRRKQLTVRLEADGHPGYTTTSRMICETALIIAAGAGTGRTGCITPALALGAEIAERFGAAGMRFSTTSP